MVNAFQDFDFNGSLFYYKGHVVHMYSYENEGLLIKYFEYNGNRIYIDPVFIITNDKTGNKCYRGPFIYDLKNKNANDKNKENKKEIMKIQSFKNK